MTTAAPTTPPAKRPHFLKYRMDRKNYWIAIACLAGVQVAAALFFKAGGVGMWFVWVMVYAWRLHDFGRSGWWAVAATVLVACLPFVVILAADAPMVIGAVAILAFLCQAGFTIFVGSVPGDRFANRYHDMPNAKPRAEEVF